MKTFFQDDADELNESFQPGYVSTGYQTMTDSRSLFQNPKQQSQNRPSSQYTQHHDNPTQREWINQQNDGYTPRYSMSRTRNRYRPKSQKPSECDDSLFGKPVKQDFKEWKAPWDQTRNFEPLIYDSTDRTGHCSLESPRNVRPTKSASTRRPWR